MNKLDPADWCIIFRRAKCQDTLDTMVGGAVRKSKSAAEKARMLTGTIDCTTAATGPL